MPKKKKTEEQAPLQEPQDSPKKEAQLQTNEAVAEAPVPSENKPKKRTRSAPKAKTQPTSEAKAPELTDAAAPPPPKPPVKRTRKQAPPTEESAEKPTETPTEKPAKEPPNVEAPEPPQLPPPTPNLPTVKEAPTDVDTAVPPIRFPDFEQEKKNFWSRVLMLLLLGAVIFASVMVLIYRPGAYSERTNSVRFLYTATSADTQIVINGSVLEGRYPGACTAVSYSANGNAAAALIGGTLYLIDGRDVTLLAADVVNFLISQNGKVAVYRTAQNALYYAALGREIETATISTDSCDGRFCLSPNGKEFFYTYIRDEAVYVDVYSRTGSKPLLKSFKGLTPIAVGDRCEHLYYRDEVGDLFYLEKGGEIPVKLYAVALGEPTLTFNRDFSELLIHSENGTQLWVRGERVVIPANLTTGEQLQLLPNQRVAARSLPLCKQYLQNSFRKAYYLKRGGEQDGLLLMYLNRKGALSVVSFVDEGAGAVTVTDKGVYFLVVEKRDDDSVMKHLYHCAPGKSEAKRLVWDVKEFLANSDGSCVFYTDQHSALYAMRLGQVEERRADTINAGSLRVTADDAFFYRVGEMLYTSDNGDEPRVLWGEAAPTVLTDGHTAYFIATEADGTLTVYANHRNRRHAEVIATGVGAIS